MHVSNPKLLFFALTFLCASFALANDYAAVKLTDPTSPWVGTKIGSKQQVANRKPILNSILAGKSRKLAIINGISLSEGERLENIVLLKINKYDVDIRTDSGLVRLQLDSADMHKEKIQ